MTGAMRVLIVDDDPDDRALAARELAGEFPDICTIEVGDAATFETAVERGGFDLVITEFRLGWSDGLSVLRELKYRYPEIPVIMFTGAGSEEVAVEAMRVGLDDYVLKGPDHVVGLPVAATSVLEGARERQARRQAEEALRSSEAHLRALFASMSDVILVLDRDGRYLEIAPTSPELLYRPAAETLGKTEHELFPPEQADAFLDAIRRALDTRSTVEIEYMLQIRGEDMWFAASISPMLEDSVVWVARDITEHKRAEEALQSLTPRYEAILASVPDIIMEVDVDKVYTWANAAGHEFFGDDVIGREAADYFEGEQETYDVVQPLFEGSEDVIYVESWQRRKDGEKRLLAWWCRVLTDVEGNATGALSTARDITERKQAEEALQQHRAMLLRSQRMAHVGSWVFDPVSLQIEWSEEMFRIYGLDPAAGS